MTLTLDPLPLSRGGSRPLVAGLPRPLRYRPSDVATLDEAALIAGLRARDESAFVELVDRYSAALRRFALTFVRTGAVADEVVQEAWIAVLNGIDRFEGRSSLKTWLYRIVANQARTRASREARSVPFSALASEDDDSPSVDPDRFRPAGSEYAGHWTSHPVSFDTLPEQRLLSGETRAVIDKAIGALPATQRLVITLRDIEGFDSAEVAELLDLSEGNQRVLLHRARSRVRAALETYLEDTP